MPFTFVHGDITEMEADAIVNAANPSLLGGGGVDGAIHRAAGPELRKECAGLGGCVPGEAKRTAAYNLRAKYVIHTVGPVWEGGGHGEAEILASCYRNSLKLAAESGCASVIFPLISAGAYGFPKRVALTVAEEAIGAFLADGHDADGHGADGHGEMDVRLALYDPPYTLRAGYRELIRDLGRRSSPAVPVSASRPAPVPGRKKSSRQEKADKSGEREKQAAGNSREPAPSHFLSALSLRKDAAGYPFDGGVSAEGAADAAAAPPDISLEQALSMIDESFSEMLLRKIDERGMKDSECYRRANVDRKLFSKIRSDPQYRPSKATAIAFAVALELSLPETEELLLKAGYALSPSAPFDVIVRYFIERGNYNIYAINEALYAFDQKQLGA